MGGEVGARRGAGGEDDLCQRVGLERCRGQRLQAAGTVGQLLDEHHRQAQLACLAVELDDGQARLTQRRASDGVGVDRVGLAPLAAALADDGHEVRRYPDRGLAGAQSQFLRAWRSRWAQLDVKLRRPREDRQMLAGQQLASGNVRRLRHNAGYFLLELRIVEGSRMVRGRQLNCKSVRKRT